MFNNDDNYNSLYQLSSHYMPATVLSALNISSSITSIPSFMDSISRLENHINMCISLDREIDLFKIPPTCISFELRTWRRWSVITEPIPATQLQTFLANLCSKQMGYLCCWETTWYMEPSPNGVRRKVTSHLQGGMPQSAKDSSSYFFFNWKKNLAPLGSHLGSNPWPMVVEGQSLNHWAIGQVSFSILN